MSQTTHHHHVVIVGTGISAIATAISLLKNNVTDFIMLERNNSPGGTWTLNKYPGCACDIPFAMYSFSFLPFTTNEVFAPSDEIEHYLNRVIDAHDLRGHMRFGVNVEEAIWSETSSSYAIRTSTNDIFNARYLCSCTGQLNVPRLPTFVSNYIAARSSKSRDGDGPIIMHSANYDRSVDLHNKTVAIIGNGATGVQLVEAIQPIVKTLLLFQRSPKWVVPKPLQNISPIILKPLQLLPFNLGNRLLRFSFYSLIEIFHFIVSNKNALSSSIQRLLRFKLLQSNPNIAVPAYRPGCSRILFHAGYPEIMARDNVSVINSAIACFTEQGDIKTIANTEYSADVIIVATGFEPGDCGPRFKVSHTTFDPSTTLFGISTPAHPNLFISYGPHTNTILGSVTFFSECVANYIGQLIAYMTVNHKTKITAKEDNVRTYNNNIRRSFMFRPELDNCNTWYKTNAAALPITNYPGSMTSFWWLTRRFRPSDYDIQ